MKIINNQITEQIKQYEELIDKIKDDMVNMTGIPASIFENMNPNSTGFRGNHNTDYNPCENCPNNPMNNPFTSGFCNCALPALYNPIY